MKSRILIVWTLISLAGAGDVCAQPQSDAERTADRSGEARVPADVSAPLEPIIAQHKVPGMAAAVVQGTETVATRGVAPAGATSAAPRIPRTAATPTRGVKRARSPRAGSCASDRG